MDSKTRNRILLVLFIGVLMGALDIAILGPALPAIRSQFQVSDRMLAWIFSLYVLFNLIGTPLMARLSDQYGRKMIYILDVSLFALGSLIVALSGSFWIVLVGRAVQGFGAGGIFPVASAVIGDTFPPENRGRALGLIGAVFGLAFLIGPLLGALILAFASWHWLFLINLPIAAVVILLGVRILPSSRPAQDTSFDWLGMAALAVLLASLAWGLNQIDTQNFFQSLVSMRVLPFLLVFVGMLFVVPWIEQRAANPILPPSLFNRRQLSLAYALSTGAGIGESSLVFIPLLAVIALSGYGVTQDIASFLLMPVVVAMAFGSPLAGRMLDRFGSRTVVLSGTIIMSIGMFLLGWFSTSLVMFIVSGVLIGFGMAALLGAPLRYIMLNEAHASERTVAQGVVAVFTSAGQLIGSALVGAIAASGAKTVHSGAAAGYSLAFLVMSGLGVMLVLLAFFLKHRQAEQRTVQKHEQEEAASQESEPYARASSSQMTGESR